MTTTSGTTNTSASSIYSQLNGASSTTTNTAQETSDRFLKLLVAQMKNQDPLSPMDNAQVTSQMAQINTVTGIEKLNTSVGSLGSQFMQSQVLQGAALIGKSVQVEGNKLTLEGGKASGRFELASAADSVKVEVLSASGRVVDTIDLGAGSKGVQDFNWTAPTAAANESGLTFRVSATRNGTAVTSTTQMQDQVKSISTAGGELSLTLKSGATIGYDKVLGISA
jgi:flagellar basal-body rod modification protein FlgD